MEALAVSVLFAGVVTAAAVSVTGPKEALSEFFGSAPASFRFDARKHSVELCWDLCDYYEMKSGATTQAWEVVFLHQYQISQSRGEFRARYQVVANSIAEKYSKACPPQSAESSSCLLRYLGTRSHVKYASVRYDEGYRCQVWGSLTSPRAGGQGTCTKVKHAS